MGRPSRTERRRRTSMQVWTRPSVTARCRRDDTDGVVRRRAVSGGCSRGPRRGMRGARHPDPGGHARALRNLVILSSPMRDHAIRRGHECPKSEKNGSSARKPSDWSRSDETANGAGGRVRSSPSARLHWAPSHSCRCAAMARRATVASGRQHTGIGMTNSDGIDRLAPRGA